MSMTYASGFQVIRTVNRAAKSSTHYAASMHTLIKTLFGILMLSFVVLLIFLSPLRTKTPSRSENRTENELKRTDRQTQEKCVAKDHVFFLKLLRCGSSTVQNIFMRRGFSKKQTFVLPPKGLIYGHPGKINKNMTAFVRSNMDRFRSAEIFTHSMRFHPEIPKLLMPRDTFSFTVIREPSSLFESIYNFYLLNEFHADEYKASLDQFLGSFDVKTLKNRSLSLRRKSDSIGINQMAFGAGLEPEFFNNAVEVHKLIAKMEEQFDLVLIAEQMERSLVLLADLMCWPIEDVTFLKLNARSAEAQRKSNLTEADRKKLRALNSADFQIYDHFLKKFQQRLKTFGVEEMDKRLLQLKTRNKQLKEECVARVLANDDGLGEVNTFEVKKGASDVCRMMAMSESDFTEKLRSQHYIALDMFPILN